MAIIYLSLGSNIEPQKNICAALDELRATFGDLDISSVYESEAVGFKGQNFYNLVVGIETDMPVAEISKRMKQIEGSNGRDRSAPRFSARSLDIDILTVDDIVGHHGGIDLPRDEVLKNAFVLQPMAQIAQDKSHPVTGKSYGLHWREFDKKSQKLCPIAFQWDQILL